MSSERFLTPGMPLRRSEIAFWNSSEVVFTPKSRRLKQYSPACVANVVICLLDSPSSSWWYAFERSNLLKTVEPFRSAIKSSMVGIGCFILWMASFAFLMSMQIRTPLFFLGTTPTELTHGVGPLTSPMTPISLRRFNSASTSFLTRKSILRCRCVTGGTEDSIWRLIMTPENFPILPSNSEGNSSGIGTDTLNVKLNVIIPSASAEWAPSKFCCPSRGISLSTTNILALQHSPEFHRGINKSSDRYRLLGSVGK